MYKTSVEEPRIALNLNHPSKDISITPFTLTMHLTTTLLALLSAAITLSHAHPAILDSRNDKTDPAYVTFWENGCNVGKCEGNKISNASDTRLPSALLFS